MDRFQHIEELFQRALQRDRAQRDAFVRDACQGDAALHREVSSLLAHHEEDGVESWAAAAAARLMAERGSLDPGTSLGSYRIERFLAAGGMGEVYGAHDTKLGRQVAIKILPDGFTHDPERLARFRREAQVLAALNHPHIGAIYGLEEANGRQFLVLELIDGETLADRLTRGRLSVDDALAIARQIADALESAHEKGIVHRDLKPSNVVLTHDGTVKVLDFGLAKITDAEDGSSVDRTIASPGMETGIGVILGTAAYMSPEQARGRTADKRSDIWAFGCVLYEMLTGKARVRRRRCSRHASGGVAWCTGLDDGARRGAAICSYAARPVPREESSGTGRRRGGGALRPGAWRHAREQSRNSLRRS